MYTQDQINSAIKTFMHKLGHSFSRGEGHVWTGQDDHDFKRMMTFRFNVPRAEVRMPRHVDHVPAEMASMPEWQEALEAEGEPGEAGDTTEKTEEPAATATLTEPVVDTAKVETSSKEPEPVVAASDAALAEDATSAVATSTESTSIESTEAVAPATTEVTAPSTTEAVAAEVTSKDAAADASAETATASDKPQE